MAFRSFLEREKGKAGDMAQVVEHLPSKGETQSPKSQYHKKRKKQEIFFTKNNDSNMC
jgi:hypothetical protein